MLDILKEKVSIITHTAGRKSINLLIESIKSQNVPVHHIIIFDDKREDDFLYPAGNSYLQQNSNVVTSSLNPYSLQCVEEKYSSTVVVLNGDYKSNIKKSIGLMLASSQYVTFADDNVMYENDHLASMLLSLGDSNWSYCRRKIWSKMGDDQYEFLGVDLFESIGHKAVENKILDNNCVLFKRRLGTSMAVMFRENNDIAEEKMLFDFLNKHGGKYVDVNLPSVNVVCEDKLSDFFRKNCTIV